MEILNLFTEFTMADDGSTANPRTVRAEVDVEETSVIHITDASEQLIGEKSVAIDKLIITDSSSESEGNQHVVIRISCVNQINSVLLLPRL